jgi:hypothetical protein
MKVSMKVLVGALGGVVAGVGLAATISGSMAVGILDFWFTDEKLYRVKLIPQGANGGTLLAQLDKGKKCSGNFEGCMKFPEDKVGLIKFYLPGSKKKDRQCPEPDDLGPESQIKVITEIKLTTTEDGNFADGSKGDFNVAPDPWLKLDAFPNVKADGVIYTADTTTGRSHVWLTNDNSHDAELGPRTFWYQVTVTKCSDPTVKWTTDPRGVNTGLN